MNYKLYGTLLFLTLGLFANIAISDVNQNCSGLLTFTVKTLNNNKQVNLCDEYKGKVLLIVNTASKCAYTPQYKGLESLYEEYKDKGFFVLGFPSNEFGKQEPGTEAQIKDFCELTYNVKFPMFTKTKVTKKNADPLYMKLGELAGEYPQWNFHKYLIDRNGNLVGSFKSQIKPYDEVLIKKIKSIL